jgi:uncharacterized protein with von Willebrand factor type A (vWA) domain
MPQNNSNTLKGLEYFFIDNDGNRNTANPTKQNLSIKTDELERLFETIATEVLRERTPDLHELGQALQERMSIQEYQKLERSEEQKLENTKENKTSAPISGTSIITMLIQKGYLKDSQKWLTKKGFVTIGRKILKDIMRPLKSSEFGLHETVNRGIGSLTLDSTKKYELGNDLRLLNVPMSLLNMVQRNTNRGKKIEFPLQISVDDLEEYQTSQDVTVSIVYCIDLSSTMRYSTMFGDISRIEAAKKALWSLFLLNQKFFPSDSISVIGFGALASKVSPQDIPYLKTFEPGSDFLHYTNYQAAFRLAARILQKEASNNKRIVLITDGHPSACFIDDKKDQDNILSQKPYSHFYSPDSETIERVRNNHELTLDLESGKVVYLCYRYRQVDGYIADRTITDAKKYWRNGIQIDTIMISEEDSLLSYVNEMEKAVKGRSYYMNPSTIDRALLNDYLSNRQMLLKS